MCDPLELAAKTAGEAAANALDSEPLRNLLGPITKEVGFSLGEVGSVFRFYTSENLTRVFTKWAHQRQRQPISATDFKRVLPLLQAASLQSNDDLQEKWAALLESAVTDPGSILPSFGNTLSQLTAEEAKYLDELWETVKEPKDIQYPHLLPQGEYFSFGLMMYVIDPALSEHQRTYQERKYLRVDPSPKQKEAFAKFDKLYLMAHDFERLGIIGTQSQVVQGRGKWVETHSGEVEIPGEPFLTERKVFTSYGKTFMAAVTPKRPAIQG